MSEAASGIEVTVRYPHGEMTTVALQGPSLRTVAGVTEALDSYIGDSFTVPVLPVAESDPALRLHGAVIDLRHGLVAEQSITGPRLVVSSGPMAGMAVPLLANGSVAVGRGRDAAVQIGDPELSRLHFSVTGNDGTWTVADAGSSHGTWCEGVQVETPRQFADGQVVVAGGSEFRLRTGPPEEISIKVSDEGEYLVNRHVRTGATPQPVKVQWPEPLRERAKSRFNWLSAAAPLVIAVGLAVFTGRIEMLLFAAMSPVMMVANSMAERKRSKEEQEQSAHGRHRQATDATHEIIAAANEETHWRRRTFPDPGEVRQIALGPTGRLWERRSTDSDFLVMRVGSAAQPARLIEINGKGEDKPATPTLPSVPVEFDLQERGVLGIAGLPDRARPLARALCLQLAALHSPRELILANLLRDPSHADWEWMRWLPHARSTGGAVRVGFDEDSLSARLSEFGNLVEQRRDAIKNQARRGKFLPAAVVFVEDPEELAELPAMRTLLDHGPSVGVYLVCSADRGAQLPQECTGVVRMDADDSGLAKLELQGEAPIVGITPDAVAAELVESAARRLTPFRPAGRDDDDSGGIPKSVRLLDTLGLRDAPAGSISALWAQDPSKTEVIVGETADGPFTIDIRRDGPHGLVAGTSGAGKSQFLIGFIAALAIGNTPEDIQFVLVDFKGGGAFSRCADLPHTGAMVSDLDGGGARRAITALSAEANRRKQLFALHGGDLGNYEDARRLNPDDPNLKKQPRLMVIVDEFAQLAMDHEDLLDEFNRIAQIGRSLGMHMILATQRPAGVISGQIKSNSDLRCCLRVVDSADSDDVIDTGIAADIAKRLPGRAYFRASDLLTEVQTAAIALPRPGKEVARPTRVVPRPWVETFSPIPEPPALPEAEPDPRDTDLHQLVELIESDWAALVEQGKAQLPAPPFLPELPEFVDARDLQRVAARGIALGIEDDPGQQRQEPFYWKPSTTPLLILGSAQRGRTTALRTVGAQLAATYSPDDVHLYGFDFGGAGLRSLDQLPHTGAVIGRAQVSRASRLADKLVGELNRRMTMFESSGFEHISGAAAAGVNLPELVVLIDQWEVIADREGAGGPIGQQLTKLVNDGPPYGISVVASSGTRYQRDLSEISAKILLPFSERQDYSNHISHVREVPERMGPGRALIPRTTDFTQIQVAVWGDTAEGSDQIAALGKLAAELPVPTKNRPFRVDEIPGSISLEDALLLGPRDLADGSARLPAGVGGDELALFMLDPFEEGMLVVAGAPRSGRTSLLGMWATWLAQRDFQVVGLAQERSPLLASMPEIFASYASGTEAAIEQLENGSGQRFLLLDDAESAAGSAETELCDFIGLRSPEIAVLATVDASRMGNPLRNTVPMHLAGARNGLLLHPNGIEHRGVLGLRDLSRDLAVTEPGGRGLAILSGSNLMVQVPRSVENVGSGGS